MLLNGYLRHPGRFPGGFLLFVLVLTVLQELHQDPEEWSQSPGEAEPWTHLLALGEPRVRSRPIRSCLRTTSAYGLETSATEIGQSY